MSMFFATLGFILSTWLFWKYICLFLYQIKSPENKNKMILAEMEKRYASKNENSSFDDPSKLYVRFLSDDDLLTERVIIEKELKSKELVASILNSIVNKVV